MAKEKEGITSIFKKNIGGGGSKRVLKYPDKKTINLVRYNTEKSNRKDILVIILITLSLVAFGKFAVFDQFEKIREAQAQYHIVQEELMAIRQANANYDEVKEKYDEVTDWYLTTGEKSIIDKEEVLAMLEQDLMPYVEVLRAQVSGSTVTVPTGITDLPTVSTFLLKLQRDPRNATATVTTTAAATSPDGEERVTSYVIINFVGGPIETEEDGAKESEQKNLSDGTDKTTGG